MLHRLAGHALLDDELARREYDLEVVRKFTQAAQKIRRAEIDRMRA